MKELNEREKDVVRSALSARSAEVSKLLKKAEKLGLKKASAIKDELLEIEALRNKLT